MNRIAALDKLSKHFTDDDLLNIAFELDASHAVSEKSSHNDLVRDLLNYCQARGILDRLAERCAVRMPDVDWRGILLTPVSQPNKETSATFAPAFTSASGPRTSPNQNRALPFLVGGAGLIGLLAVALFVINQLAARPGILATSTETATATSAVAVAGSDTPMAMVTATVTDAVQPTSRPTDAPAPTAIPSNTPAPPTNAPVPPTIPSTETAQPAPTTVRITPSRSAPRTPRPVLTRRPTTVVIRPTLINAVVDTATPTPASISCDNRTFLELSTSQTGMLGCPDADRLEVSDAVIQDFERGSMLWVKSLGRIFVIIGTRVETFWDTWKEGENVYSCRSDESGVPLRGFGRVWCDRTEIRTALGLTTSGEKADVVEYQGFENGIAFRLLSSQKVIVFALR